MIVITGGTGFIGSSLIWGLNKKGITDIIVVDRIDNDKWKNLSRLRYKDILDFAFFPEKLKYMKNIETIFHLGAITDTTLNDDRRFIEQNYEYSKSIAKICVEKDIKLIYASSAATYGDGSQGFSDDEKNIYKLKPLNLYGFSKHIFDLWVLENNLFEKFTGLKFFNVYGPNEYHKGKMASFIYQGFNQGIKYGKIRLFRSYKNDIPDGYQKRDFIYIKDVIDMILFIYEKMLAGLFNIGTGKSVTFIDIVKTISSVLNKEIEIEFIDMPEELKERYQYVTYAEMGKLKNNGFDKETSPLDEGVSDYIKNYLLEKKYIGEVE